MIGGLLLAGVLIAGNAFFVGVEFALLAARQTALVAEADRSARARQALGASRRLPVMIAGCQFGITLCSLGLGAVGEPVLAHLLEPVFQAARIPEDVTHPVVFALALSLMSAAHMLFGEMLPKNLALAAPERAAVLLAPILVAFVATFRPLITALTLAAGVILRPFGVRLLDDATTGYTPDQIGQLVEEAREEGLLGRAQHQRVTEALHFETTTVAHVMIPHGKVIALPASATAEDLEHAVARTGFSRFPVVDPDGAWCGYLHLADGLGPRGKARSESLGPRIRVLPVVRAETSLRDALNLLQSTRAHVTEVRDGDQSLGLVMLEDILEELVGEVQDITARQRP